MNATSSSQLSSPTPPRRAPSPGGYVARLARRRRALALLLWLVLLAVLYAVSA